MKTFKFTAKQGQEAQVCRLLTQNVAKPQARCTSKGVVITCKLPEGVSRRSVEKMLYAHNVPGATSQRSIPIVSTFNGVYSILDRFRPGEILKTINKGRFEKITIAHSYCECCGHQYWFEKQ